MKRGTIGFLAILVMAAGMVQADWDAGGISVSSAGDAVHAPTMVFHSSYGVCVVWQQDAGVYVQRFNALGCAQWAAGGIQVSGFGPGFGSPCIVSSANGWIVAWIDNSSNSVYAQLIDHNGAFLWSSGGTFVRAAQNPANLQMVHDGSSGAILAWIEYRDNNVRACGQRMNSLGDLLWSSEAIPISEIDANCLDICLVSDGANGAVAIYDRLVGPMPYNRHISAARVTGQGSVSWRTDVINWTGWSQNTEAIAIQNGGVTSGVVVASENDESGILVQMIDLAGVTYWHEDGNARGKRICPSNCFGISQSKPALALDATSNVVVAYELKPALPNAVPQVYAQKIGASPEFALHWATPGVLVSAEANQLAVAAMAPKVICNSGSAMVFWHEQDIDRPAVMAQSLTSNGVRSWTMDTPLSSDTLCSISGGSIRITRVWNNSACIAWNGAPTSVSPSLVHMNIFRDSTIQLDSMRISYRPGYHHTWQIELAFKTDVGTKAAVYYQSLLGCTPPFFCRYSDAYVDPLTAWVHKPVLPPFNKDKPRTFPPSTVCFKIVPGNGMAAFGGNAVLDAEDPCYAPDITYPIYVDAENATIVESDCPDYFGMACFTLTDNECDYGGFIECKPLPPIDIEIPTLADDGRCGNKSIAFNIPARDEMHLENIVQRVLIDLDLAIPLYKDRYEAFSLKIVPSTDAQGNVLDYWRPTLLTQWHQDNPCGPVLGLNFMTQNEGGINVPKIYLWKLGAEPYQNEDSVWVYPVDTLWPPYTIAPNQWYDFIIGYKGDPYGECAWLKLWVNNYDISNPTWESGPGFELGFPKDPPIDGNGNLICPMPESATHCRETLQGLGATNYGLYRTLWKIDTPESNLTELEARYDEIRVGHTFQDVEPPINQIAYSCDPVRERIIVNWHTNHATTNNKLYYRRAGVQTWSSKNVTPAPSNYYTSSFIAEMGSTYEFKIFGDCAEQTLRTLVFTARCDDGHNIEEVARREEIPIAPFLDAVPNPFNPTTMLTFSVAAASHVELAIYSVNGALVRTVASGRYERGVHGAAWDGRNENGSQVCSGVYFARMTLKDAVLTRKLVLLK